MTADLARQTCEALGWTFRGLDGQTVQYTRGAYDGDCSTVDLGLAALRLLNATGWTFQQMSLARPPTRLLFEHLDPSYDAVWGSGAGAQADAIFDAFCDALVQTRTET